MVVISLHKTLSGELHESLGKMSGGYFSDRLISKVVLHLMAKKRTRLCRLMSYFTATICAYQADPTTVIFSSRGSPDRFMSLLQRYGEVPSQLSGVATTFSFDTADGDKISVGRGMISTLLCAHSIVLEVLGIETYQDYLDIFRSAHNPLSVSTDAADKLSRWLDRYRQKRLGSSQAHLKRKSVLQFLSDTFDGERYSVDDLTSDHILSYWEAHHDRAGLDVGKYSSAHDLFLTMIDVLSQVTMLDIRDQDVEDGGGIGSSDREDWLALQNEAGELKYLKASIVKPSEAFLELPESGLRHILSASFVLRFGPLQSSLKDGISEAAYRDKWNEKSAHWQDIKAAVSDLRSQFETSCWAVVYLLLEDERDGALSLLPELTGHASRELLETLMPDTPGAIPLFSDIPTNLIRSIKLGDSELTHSIRASAREGWKARKRTAGFKDAGQQGAADLGLLDTLAPRLAGALHYVKTLDRRVQALNFEPALTQAYDDRFDRVLRDHYSVEGQAS